MTPQSIRFLLWLAIAQCGQIMPVLADAPGEPLKPTPINLPVVQPKPCCAEVSELQLKALDEKVTIKLEANEKLVQAKVDQAAAIAQTLENGRKRVDWWLTLMTIILASASVAAALFPLFWRWRMKQDFDAEVKAVKEAYISAQAFGREIKDDMRQSIFELREAKREAREELQAIHAAANQAKADSAAIERLKRATIQDKSPEQLRELAAKAKESDNTPVTKLLTKAFGYAEKRHWAEAAARWRALTDIEPESEIYWFNLGYALHEQAEQDVPNRLARIQEACTAYAQAIRIKPDFQEASFNLGGALLLWAQFLDGEAQQEKFDEACQKFAEVVDENPKDHEAYRYWGDALADWAKLLEGDAQQLKFAEACEKFAEVISNDPKDHEAYRYWGNVLSDWAKFLEADAQQEKFDEACKKYAEAVKADPNQYETYNNWGVVLGDWAQALEDQERVEKFAEACEKFSRAEQIKRDEHNLYCNWGSTLSDWARSLEGEDRHSKFLDACKKYAEATRLNPKDHESFDNWGSVLLYQVQILKDGAREAKLREAKDVLMKAEALKPGAGSYNLACAAALSGQPDEARRWLMQANHANVSEACNCEYLKKDNDLDNLRDLQWFKVFLAEVCGEDKKA